MQTLLVHCCLLLDLLLELLDMMLMPSQILLVLCCLLLDALNLTRVAGVFAVASWHQVAEEIVMQGLGFAPVGRTQ